jgi:hypothetical protein
MTIAVGTRIRQLESADRQSDDVANGNVAEGDNDAYGNNDTAGSYLPLAKEACSSP